MKSIINIRNSITHTHTYVCAKIQVFSIIHAILYTHLVIHVTITGKYFTYTDDNRCIVDNEQIIINVTFQKYDTN